MAEKSDEDIIKEVGLDHNQEGSNDGTKLEEVTQEETTTQEPIEEPILEEVNLSEDEENEKKASNENKKVQKKQPRILRILIISIVVLLSLLAIGLLLFYLGFFDPEEVPMEDKKPKEVMKVKKPQLDINIDELDKNKINKKLNSLTKHEIMNKHELEAEEQRIKLEEEKRKEELKKAEEEKKKKMQEEINAQYSKIEEEKKLLEEQQKQIKDEQEKFLALQEQLKAELENKKAELLHELENKKNMGTNKSIDSTEPMAEQNVDDDSQSMDMIDSTNEMKEQMGSNSTTENSMQFLSFINVATIKGQLYKSYLDELQGFEKNISLCRDPKNRIEIYFGPYSTNAERKKVYDRLMNKGYKQAYLSDLTKEEYNKRCKY